MIYRFGDCELDTQLFHLRRGGVPIQLRPKVFQVLTHLLEHRHRVVTRQQLFEHMWPKQFVSDAALESCIKAVRRAIGDSGAMPRMIQTVRGYGYRFMVAVEACDATPAAIAETRTPLDQEHVSTPPSPAPPTLVGERKPVTILCCGLAAPTTVHEPPTLDALHRFMRALYELARSEMQRYGGTLQHLAGDRLMILFGVPVAQEDHARRAVLAALGLHQRLCAGREALHLPSGEHLSVRMGLHTGLVAVGGIDAAREMAAAVIGDIELVARALQEIAEPDSILCSDTTARQVQGTVYLEAVRPVQGARQSSPIMVHKVLGVGPRRSPVVQRGERALSRFVGRAREMATLQALLAQVEDGRGQVVGLVGEPGIGKSRLMYEFRRSVAGRRLTYLEGRCLSYGGSTPYLPVLDLLRHHCGITDADGPETIQAKVRLSLQEGRMVPDEWEPYLLQLLGVPDALDRLATLSPQAIKARTFATLTQMCMNGARRRALIIEVEDLHWIDPTSEEYLASLVEQLSGVPILLLTTYRPGYRPLWMAKSYVTQIALQRLTSDDSLQVVQGLLHTRQLPEALGRMILAKADGNPFFLEELARTVMEARQPRVAPVVPDTVQAVLAARIDRLPPEEKRLLQTAAVIGKDLAFPVLQAIAGLPEEELQQRLVYLQDAEFVYETARFPALAYTFKHVLTQEVAYASLLQSTRQQIHQRLAQVLAQRFPETAEIQPELLAHHYTEAGLGGQAIGYWQRAGQRANERSAHAEAIVHLSKGLAVLHTLPDTPEHPERELSLQIALGTSLTATKGWAAPEVEGVYTRARELCQHIGETPQLSPVLWGLWHFHAVRGEPQTARELGEQFLGLARRAGDPARLLAAHFVLGGALFMLGEFGSAQDHWERSLTYYVPKQHVPTRCCTARTLGCFAWPGRLICCGISAMRTRRWHAVRRRWIWLRSSHIHLAWRWPWTMLPCCANFVENPTPSMSVPKRPWPFVPSRSLPITWPGGRLCEAGQWPRRATGRQG
jgi:DNA-binding winged helix-turn-helix (wHTH) protein/tetratricopeptide (TPR) repeat protein